MLDTIKESILAKLLLMVIIAWVIMAIIFGFTDLQISQAVRDSESAWGNFGDVYGEGPGYGLIAIGIVILIASGTTELKKQKIPAYVVIIIAMILFILGFAFADEEGLNEDLIIYGGFIGFPVLIFTILFFNKDWSEYKNIAIVIVLLAIIVPLLYVQILKLIWGRVRPRDVFAGEGVFTAWYIINGYTDNHSFPSGHTSMGFMLLPLLITVREREWKDPAKLITWILVVGWALFVGASRVIVEAHFASDVLFSAGMASVVTILLYNKFCKDRS